MIKFLFSQISRVFESEDVYWKRRVFTWVFFFGQKMVRYRLSSHKFKIGQVGRRNNLVSFIDKTLICSSFSFAWHPIMIRYFWGTWGVQRDTSIGLSVVRAINSITMVVELLILIKIDLSVQWERIFLAWLRLRYCDNW